MGGITSEEFLWLLYVILGITFTVSLAAFMVFNGTDTLWYYRWKKNQEKVKRLQERIRLLSNRSKKEHPWG